MTPAEPNTSLFVVDSSSYGTEYNQHLLDQYTLYVKMADKVSERRQAANTYLLSANSLLVTVYGILASAPSALQRNLWQYFVPLAGLMVSITWLALIRSYRQLNAGKFKVIHLLESRLPAAVYDAEWSVLGKGSGGQYLPLTHVEVGVPLVFAVLYVLLLVFALSNPGC